MWRDCKMRSDVLNKNSNAYDGKSRAETLLEWNYINCGSPIVSCNQVGAAAVLADAARVSMLFPGANGELYYMDSCRVGAFTAAGDAVQMEGTIPAVDTASTVAGLNIQLDHNATDNAGMEMTLGPPHGSKSSSFLVGTHSGYVDATFFTAAWDDWDGIAIGFRSVQAFDTGHAPIIGAGAAADGIYTDFAAFGSMLATDNIEIMTDLNNSGTSSTKDTGDNVTDSQNHRFRIILGSDGAVTYKHIGNAVAGSGALAAPSATASFTFDSGDEIIPYVVYHGAGTDDVPLFLKDIKVVRTPSRDGHSVA